MLRFFLGFVAASVLWGAAAFVLYGKGFLAFDEAEPDDLAEVLPDEPDDEATPGKKRGRRARRGRPERARASASTPATRPERSTGGSLPTGEATTGDDLDWNGERKLDMAAGEEQLSGKAIEVGFDSAMSRIRRCLVLVPAEGDVTGKLTFGMRVGSDGVPRAVNLTGPAVVTSGESGSCLRKAAEGIRFGKFAGPDMLFKYPITLQ